MNEKAKKQLVRRKTPGRFKDVPLDAVHEVESYVVWTKGPDDNEDCLLDFAVLIDEKKKELGGVVLHLSREQAIDLCQVMLGALGIREVKIPDTKESETVLQ